MTGRLTRSSPARSRQIAAGYILGTVVAAAVSASVLVGVDKLADDILSSPLPTVLIFTTLVLLLTADVSDHVLTMRRQTPKNSFDRFTPLTAGAIAGFDIGLGATTYRVSNVFWAWVAFALWLGGPAPIVGTATYGAMTITTYLLGPRFLERLGRNQEQRRVPLSARRSSLVIQSTDFVTVERQRARWAGRVAILASLIVVAMRVI